MNKARNRVEAAIAALALLLGITACGPAEPGTAGAPSVVQRLTEAQYRQTIADVFGDDIRVAGRFEPMVRKDGLVQVGAGAAAVTPSGFEQFDRLGRSIAAQLVAPERRSRTMSATKFSSQWRFRRPFSASTSNADPTFTTTRLASIKRRAQSFRSATLMGAQYCHLLSGAASPNIRSSPTRAALEK